MDNGHAPLPPSAAHRWMRCTASVGLIATLPQQDTDSVYSREGTFAHTVAARCLLENLDAVALIGETDGEFTVDADMADHVQVYLDHVRDTVFLSGGQLHVEQKVYLTRMVYGTSDAVIVAGDTIYVADFKYGAGVFVPAQGNEQLMIYALAAIDKFAAETCKTVVLGIVQPRCAAGSPVRTHTMTREEIDQFAGRVYAAEAVIEGVDDENGDALQPVFEAGDHCKFCPAQVMCPHLQAQSNEIAAQVFAGPPAPETMAPAEIARILDLADPVRDWIKAIEDHATGLLQAGVDVPGYVLRPTKGRRKWLDEPAVVETMTMLGVDPYGERPLLSPAQMEKRAKGQKAIIATMTVVPTTGVKLVRDNTPEIFTAD